MGGLIANKLASKYQKPVCILIKTTNSENEIVYQGSARGCDAIGVTNFKGICESSHLITFTAGHHGAFGLGVKESNISAFVNYINETLKHLSGEAMHQVDYIWNASSVNIKEKILEIASMRFLWGKDFPEALVAIENIKINPNSVTVYKKTTNTLKIILSEEVSIMKFNVSEEEVKKFQTQEMKINIVGTASANEWCGNVSAQIMMIDYEEIKENKITSSYQF